MRRSEMNEQQLKHRDLFVETLMSAGWTGLNFNEQFDSGLRVSPEASMEYSNPELTLRFDFICKDPRTILYLDSTEGKSLGLVFRCEDRLKQLLEVTVGFQDSINPANFKDKIEELLTVCPKIFKIAASGDRLIPIKSKNSR